MKIKNLEALAETPERRAALNIAEKGLEAIDTKLVLKRALSLDGGTLSVFGRDFKLSSGGRLMAALIGKCAADGAAAFEEILGDGLSHGVALGVGKPKSDLKKIVYHEGSHPMPSEDNVSGTRAILNSLVGLSARDTVLFLVSGGGSTLLSQPPCVAEKMIELVGKERDMLQGLFKAGATIQEINTLRKHMSLARGGFLAEAAHPAQVISIIFSDVPGNELGFISSGPTVKDSTTVKDAEAVMRRYGISLDKECLTETPKDDEYFERVYNILAVSNELALQEMKRAAASLGYKAETRNACVIGEARSVGKSIAKEANASKPKTALLYCGETTVTVKSQGGRGGRNQEVALGALSEVTGNRVVLSVASDGKDNGPHAGAIADSRLLVTARAKGLDPARALERNDSTTFFEAAGGLIETGETGSNVSDLMIAVTG